MQMQKLLTFFSAKILAYMPIFNDQSFNDTLTNDIVGFEKLGSDFHRLFQLCVFFPPIFV